MLLSSVLWGSYGARTHKWQAQIQVVAPHLSQNRTCGLRSAPQLLQILCWFICVVVVVVCVVVVCLRPRNVMLVAVEYKRKIPPNRISTPAKAYSAITNWITQESQITPIATAKTPYPRYIFPAGSSANDQFLWKNLAQIEPDFKFANQKQRN